MTSSLNARALLLCLPIASLAYSCSKAEDSLDKERDDDSEEADTSDTEDSDDTDDSSSPEGFTGRFELVPELSGRSGTVIVELTRASDGDTRRYEVALDKDLSWPELEDGAWGMRAWLDENGDENWDGAWEKGWEPTAVMGLELPRDFLRVPLRASVPAPILDGDPELVVLHDAAWEAARRHIGFGTKENGFADQYLDEGFSEQIFQWDSCFMTLFARYGADGFPVMATLDNFYGTQRHDGYICRVVNELDGTRGGEPDDPAEPFINPPLFGWAEHEWTLLTGDASRLSRTLPVLSAYHAWIDENVRTETGLYYTSMLGSGMDNAPRYQAYDGWVDISAQQALGREMLASLGEIHGDTLLVESSRSEHARICDGIRTWMWSEEQGFFFDLDADGHTLTDKTLASIWPVLAGCAESDQVSAVVAQLSDPSKFWRSHPFSSTSADSPYYSSDGFYWRGGVWAPTNFATIRALRAQGHHDLALEAAERHLLNLYRVWSEFVPAPGTLAAEATGDGTHTFWELYAPDEPAPGTRWDGTWLGAQDFVGWTGLGPIALLYEELLGLEPNAPEDTLRWRLHRTDRHGVLGYRFGDQLVDLVVGERADSASSATLEVDSSDAFTLIVELGGGERRLEIPEGHSSFEIEPFESARATTLLPSGPYPGYAILGNGALTVVYSDEPSLGAPGVTHLYSPDHGHDYVDGGQTLTGQGGVSSTQMRLGLEPFFAACTEESLPDGAVLVRRAFVGEEDALVVQGVLSSPEKSSDANVYARIQLSDSPDIDGAVLRESVVWDEKHQALLATFTDGRVLALGMSPSPSAHQAGYLSSELVRDGLTGLIEPGPELALGLDLRAEAGEETPFLWALAVAGSSAQAIEKLDRVLSTADPLADAESWWADWAPEELCVSGELCAQAAANLYAARASSLSGQVPADLTGQFVTDGFPQLYPRDALMVARAFELGGHPTEAWEILQDWLDPSRTGPATGAWYARYDAVGRARSGGSGADYDVPEWDSNAYLALMVERLGPALPSVDERERILQGLDYLVEQQDEQGLFEEGGIVEWPGRLPSTAMIAWAGLDAGARLASTWAEHDRASRYLAAAGRIRGGLWELLELERVLLLDDRDIDQWDTSYLFGPAWGYPPGPVEDASFEWAMENATLFGGGLRYFEGNSYGQDLFFFTTSAAVEYAASMGDESLASTMMDWISDFSNGYGLAPERIYSDGTGASEASPLSWCAAEIPVALLSIEHARSSSGAPVVDGVIDPVEYRVLGGLAVDMDGQEDRQGDPVALYAAREGSRLSAGLRVAGDLQDDTRYILYLSDTTGLGTISDTTHGNQLLFRSDPSLEPGALARVEFTSAGECVVGPASSAIEDLSDCAAFATGSASLELEVDLDPLGIKDPVQLILASETDGEESLLPAHGSLLCEGDDGLVLTRFEVDASAIAHRLWPETEEIITLSGDRDELGLWEGDAVALYDDGSHGDLVAQDSVWTTTILLERGGSISYKYLVGRAGDGSWSGVEFEGDNRSLWVQDADRSGYVLVDEVFGLRGATLLDR